MSTVYPAAWLVPNPRALPTLTPGRKCKIRMAGRVSSTFAFTSSNNSLKVFTEIKVRVTKMSSDARYVQLVKGIVPKLLPTKHKGQAGRIAIVGGSQEYTGAPYFAAISALKVGADLSHVFCTPDSALVIKSYSPELIVHPLLDEKIDLKNIFSWLERIHSVVIGPGLGREPAIIKQTMGVIERAKEMDKQIVIDADGLYLVTNHPDVIKNYKKAVLTPNVVEFARLYKKMFGCDPDPEEDGKLQVVELSKKLGSVTICRKGMQDVISDGEKVIACSLEGSSRRCGGQGDLLSGSMGTFMHWAYESYREKDDSTESELSPSLMAVFGACALTRTCNRLAFSKYKRCMTTSNMVEEIGRAFEILFE